MIAKKQFIINRASDILVGWGLEITSGIVRMVATAAGKGGAARYEAVESSMVHGRNGIPGQDIRAKLGMSETG